MSVYATPGVYFERPRSIELASPRRTDVAGFVGLAERGPLHSPRRLTGWREFRRTFGGFLPYSNLAYAVRGFFENGGRACWVVRVADGRVARSASVQIPDETGGPALLATASSPGTWAQGMEISLLPASLAATESIAIPDLQGDRLAVADISGIEPGSWVRLTQEIPGTTIVATLKVTYLDTIRGSIRLAETSIPVSPHEEMTRPAEPILATIGFDPQDESRPISIESLEFSVLVWAEGQVEERFDNVAPDPDHRNYAVRLVNESSSLVRLEEAAPPALPMAPFRASLQGGENGLRSLSIFDHIGKQPNELFGARGLETLEKVDEASILVMPDLTAYRRLPSRSQRAPRPRVEQCDLGTPVTREDVFGTVFDNATGDALAGVLVEASDGLETAEGEDIHRDETDRSGRFRLEEMLPAPVEVLFSLDGYEENAQTVTPGTEITVRLNPLDLPPTLHEADIYYGQAAMIEQCERLRDRFAILDVPRTSSGDVPDINRLRSWRARFDTPFAALYYPWLMVRDQLNLGLSRGNPVPPGGHIAGIYAATDINSGVFRPPANRQIFFSEDLTTAVGDSLQGLLNPIGINVLRAFPGRGMRVYGARTLSSDSAWRYVNVRRLMSMLEETLYDTLQWAVFEPNDPQLRFSLRLAITTLLDGLWRKGAFAGDTPEAAYQVRCDSTTTPPELEELGHVVAEVRVAPTVPYEFILLRLGFTSDELQISED
jgi:uncharacterized protein